MSETGDHVSSPGAAGNASRLGAGWFPQDDPVESFGNTVEQALRQLSVELAGLRAERDGLRLELEGIRTQYDILRQQLADRDRFSATVRELGDIVRHLTLPSRWTGDDTLAAELRGPALAPAPAPPSSNPFINASGGQAPAWTQDGLAPAFAPRSEPIAEVPPPPAPVVPPPPAPVVAAPPAPPAPPVAPATVVEEAPEVPAPPPAPAPAPPPVAAEPLADPVVAAPAPTAPAAMPEPEEAHVAAPTPPAPEPAPAPPTAPAEDVTDLWDPIVVVESNPASRTLPSPQVDRFFDQPGMWIGEPPKAAQRRDALRTWGGRAVTALLGLVVAVILLISVGPRVLPYETFFVRSGSMEPTIETGSMIFLTKVDASDLDKGDIITFDRPDKPGTLVTHRIFSVETNDQGRFFRTKGDANGTPDPWSVPASGTGWRYSFNIPKVGFVFGYLGTARARFALLAIPAVLLGALSLVDIWRPAPAAPASRSRKRR
jgi:signal peptidase I